MKTLRFFPLFSVLAIPFSLQSQTVTNAPATGQGQPTNALTMTASLPPGTKLYTLTPDDVKALVQQGYDPATLPKQVLVETDEAKAEREKMERVQQKSVAPTPPDLKNAIIYMNDFLGMTNAMIPADVISMKSESLQFRLNGHDYDYSGHFTVVLNTPRQHKNPHFGFGSPETAKLLILTDFGGGPFPLQNVIIREKKANYIDVETAGKEWIYSGSYTIQN